MKRRTPEEIQEILKMAADGVAVSEICKRYEISETSFYRIVSVVRSGKAPPPQHSARKQLEALKKTLKERDREIALLRAALKKS